MSLVEMPRKAWMLAVSCLVVMAMVIVGLAACSTLGGLTGSGGNTAERVLADLGCLTALAGAAITVAGDPAVGGAKTAMDVVGAIAKVGASNVPSSALGACKETLNYAGQDFSGLIAMVKGTKGSSDAVAPAPAPPAQRAIFAAPARPTVVRVPIQ